MKNETEISEVAQRIRSLASLPNARDLPDPDWIWVRARISAREEAAAAALGTAFLTGGLMLGRLLVARQLRYLGLL